MRLLSPRLSVGAFATLVSNLANRRTLLQEARFISNARARIASIRSDSTSRSTDHHGFRFTSVVVKRKRRTTSCDLEIWWRETISTTISGESLGGYRPFFG